MESSKALSQADLEWLQGWLDDRIGECMDELRKLERFRALVEVRRQDTGWIWFEEQLEDLVGGPLAEKRWEGYHWRSH